MSRRSAPSSAVVAAALLSAAAAGGAVAALLLQLQARSKKGGKRTSDRSTTARGQRRPPGGSGIWPVPRRRWRGDAEEGEAARRHQAQVRSEPFAVSGIPIGPCSSAWTDQYLEDAVGDLKISAHVSKTRSLDFAGKNFAYEVMPLRDFLRRAMRAEGDERYYYFRSQHAKRNKPSSLEVLGPLAADFALPEALTQGYLLHSTVLRIASAGLRMWLHYDICDNFLCCVRGRKRVVLLPPSRVSCLYVQGSSSALGSRPLDDDPARRRALWEEYPLAREAWEARHEIVLEEGEVLFIPAMWLHCTEACPLVGAAGGLCVSVNVFLKRAALDAYHDPKDVWANREVLPAQEAFKALDDKALPALKRLPPEHRSFYCRKAAASLLEIAMQTEREELGLSTTVDGDVAWSS